MKNTARHETCSISHPPKTGPTAAVIARRSYGDSEARRISGVDARLRQLRNERVRLESEIREGSSRVRLIPIAESRLGMHVPADTEVVILSRRSGPNADR